MRKWLQHRFNEAVLYCRLKDCGIGTAAAKRLSRKIGGWLRPLLYRRAA